MKMRRVDVISLALFLHHLAPSLTAPPAEPCPPDSIPTEDTCKCDPQLCSKPPCPFELSLSSEGSDTPGSCCSIYTCGGCTNDTLVQGQCPCAPGAILNTKGECECVDRHRKLVNNECICDLTLCELPKICEENSVSVSERDDCCSRNKCIKCPEDSFVPRNDHDEIEEKCVCYPCKDKECGPEERVEIIKPGKNIPGNCCDRYTCESTCTVKDVVHSNGDAWSTDDGHMCHCQNGISFCEQSRDEHCYYQRSVYKHDESWMLDNCINCTCLNGEIRCIAHSCEFQETVVKQPLCQAFNCTKECPEGDRSNNEGCRICKCNYSSKCEDILHKYGLSEDQLQTIVEEYVRKTGGFGGIATSEKGVSDQEFRAPGNGFSILAATVCLLVGFFVCAILMVAVLLIRRKRKTGSYDPNPVKVALFNNNEYISNNDTVPP